MATSGNKNVNAKLVLLGDVGTGKSSLVLRFVKGQFVEFQESTIGAAFFSQTLAVNDATVKFEIWDTAGQERYHSLAPMYYRGAVAAIIVYDITNQASFDRAKKWVQELQAQGNPNMVMALAGNKADLLDARKVSAETSLKDSVLKLFVKFAEAVVTGRKPADVLLVIATELVVYHNLDISEGFCSQVVRQVCRGLSDWRYDAQTYAQENGLFFMETSAKNASNVNAVFYEIAKRLPRVQPAPNPSGMVLMDNRPVERTVAVSCCS